MKKKVIIVLLGVLLGMLFIFNTGQVENGTYVYVSDSSCQLVISGKSYRFVGEKESYDSMVEKFKQSGSYKKFSLFDSSIYLLTSDKYGPYFTINNDGDIVLSEAFTSSMTYVFTKIDE